MTAEEREELHQFLATNWYDRDEDDEEIVAEIVDDGPLDYLIETKALIHDLLARGEEREELSALVRSSAWRFFPEGTDPPIVWLDRIVQSLDERLRRR